MNDRYIRLTFSVLAIMFATAKIYAQVSVYGFFSTYTDPSNPIVLGQYEAISGEWLEWDTLAFCDGVVMGSSAFDAGTESYMFAGIGAAPGNNSIQFWDYDVIDNAIVNNPSFNQTINAIQHDMAGDRLLALGTYAQDSTFIDFGNGTGYWEYEWGSELIELNPEESSVTSIAPIEGINGVVLGATAFDSDNDIYALVGMDYAGNQKFIQLDGTTGAVISSVNLQIPSNMGFNELECFINGETFLGIKRPYGINPNAETTALVSVNPLTGELTNLVELPQIYAFSPNASVFEQTTGLFIMLYYDFNNQSHILVVDPVEAEIVADHQINGSFIELQINNREFMVAAYGNASSIHEATAEGAWNLWPNPANAVVRMQATRPRTRFTMLQASWCSLGRPLWKSTCGIGWPGRTSLSRRTVEIPASTWLIKASYVGYFIRDRNTKGTRHSLLICPVPSAWPHPLNIPIRGSAIRAGYKPCR